MTSATDRPIILLDLQYTLIANSTKAPYPFEPWFIEHEVYRDWLVDLLRDEYVCMITVRNRDYEEASLAHLKELTGWQPQEAYFAPPFTRAPDHKRRVMVDRIFPTHGRDRAYLALESNVDTRKMYSELTVPAMPVPKHSPWRALPFDNPQGQVALW